MTDLTVFIIKSGKNPNFVDCKTSIRNQNMKCAVKYITDISPMSKAFQTMVDKCDTKYFIQVDHDMILYPNAIKTLYNKMQNVYKEVAILGCMLYDLHLEKNIYGVKIYNTEVIKNYPYQNSLSCEVDQIKAFEKDGYRFHYSPDVIGVHSPKWTKELIYERYFNLMEKFKQYKYNWLQHLPQQLFQKVQKSPTEENIYALLGAYTSISQKDSLQNREKDFHSLKRVELGRFESYFKFPTTANLYMTDVCNFKCKFCVTGDTKILDKNMLWKPIKSVSIGETILGFERKNLIKPVIVNQVFSRKAEVYRIHTDFGVIDATKEHPFLNMEGKWVTIKDYLTTKKINTHRSKLRYLSDPMIFDENDEFKKGWLAGVLEGDGCLGSGVYADKRRKNTWSHREWISLRMVDKEAIDRYQKYLQYFGVETNLSKMKKTYKNKPWWCWAVIVNRKTQIAEIKKLIDFHKNEDFYRGWLSGMFDAEGSGNSVTRISACSLNIRKLIKDIAKMLGFDMIIEKTTVRLLGGISEQIKFYSSLNPSINRKKYNLFKHNTHLKNAKILKIEYLGKKKVYNLETDSKTFWANGFAVHNCLRQSQEIEKHPEVTVELCKKLLQKYPTIKSICIAGYGEPFLAKNLFPVLKFLKGRGIFTGLITNGSMIDKKFYLLQINKPGYISVSLNASNRELHKKITLTDTFDKVKENVKLLKRLKIPIYASIVMCKEWIKDVPDFLKLAKELGIQKVDIHNLLPHALGQDQEWFEKNVLKVQDQILINKLHSLKDADMIRSFPIPIDAEPCQSCDSPWKTIGMNGNGSISICSAVHPPQKFFGNINDDSAWFDKGCIEFRDGFLNNTNPSCKRCFRNFIKDK